MRRTGRSEAGAVAVLASLVALTALAAGDVSITQTVDRTEVGDEDTFRLTVSATGGSLEDIKLPQTDDFETLSRSSSTQMSLSLGGGGAGMKRTVRYTLVMRANRTGKLTLPPSQLTVDGKTYRSEPITMTVKSGTLGPPPPTAGGQGSGFPGFPSFPGFPGFPGDDEAPSDFPDIDVPRSESDLFLQAILDKPEAYVGEQVTYSVYLMSRVDLSSVDQLTLPKLDGFWSEDLESPTQLADERRVVNGVPYRAYLLKRRALFPMKPGKAEIGRVEADVTTGFIFAGHRIHRRSNALTLDVKPLPSGAPAGFSPSNVGSWKLSVETENVRVALGQPATVRVILEGTGNVRNVSLPKLTGPDQVRVYEPTPSERVSTNRGLISGRRVHEYLVMPQRTGTVTLPALSFPHFDPTTGSYEVSRSEPVTLTIEPGSGVASAQPSADAAKNVLAGGGIRPLRHRGRFQDVTRPIWTSMPFVLAVVTPLALWLGLGAFSAFRTRWGQRSEADVHKQQAKAAKARLMEAEKLKASGPAPAFYGEVEKAVVGYLEAEVGAPLGGLRREALLAKLEEVGISSARRERVGRVLDACDFGRFAPGGGNVVRAQVLEDAERAMEET
jgi:hypothetical protein